jgi:hypothetical protein
LAPEIKQLLEQTGEPAEAYLEYQAAMKDEQAYLSHSLDSRLQRQLFSTGIDGKIITESVIIPRAQSSVDDRKKSRVEGAVGNLLVEVGDLTARLQSQYGLDLPAKDSTFRTRTARGRASLEFFKSLDQALAPIVDHYEAELTSILGPTGDGRPYLGPDGEN